MRLREYWERFWFSLWFHLDPDAKDIVALGIAIRERNKQKREGESFDHPFSDSSYDPKEGEV